MVVTITFVVFLNDDFIISCYASIIVLVIVITCGYVTCIVVVISIFTVTILYVVT